MISKLLKKLRYVFRSSITGKFVSREFAEAHPESTQKERLRD